MIVLENKVVGKETLFAASNVKPKYVFFVNECNRICSYWILLAVSEGSGWSNWVVLRCYLAVLVGVGIYFAKREKPTDDFFLAGKSRH